MSAQKRKWNSDNLCKIAHTVEEPIFELKMFWRYKAATIVFLPKLAEINQDFEGKKILVYSFQIQENS